MADLEKIRPVLHQMQQEANAARADLEGNAEPSADALKAAINRMQQTAAILCGILLELTAPPQGAPPPTPLQLHEMERRAAINRIWTESHLKGADERSKLVIEIALVALRSVFLVNGAAIVALLTFLGNAQPDVNVTMLRIAFQDFAIGLVMSLLAMGLGYIAQQLFSHSEYEKAGAVYIAVIDNEPERPNAGQSPTPLVLQIAAFFLAAGSLLFFCLGAFSALTGLFPSG